MSKDMFKNMLNWLIKLLSPSRHAGRGLKLTEFSFYIFLAGSSMIRSTTALSSREWPAVSQEAAVSPQTTLPRAPLTSKPPGHPMY